MNRFLTLLLISFFFVPNVQAQDFTAEQKKQIKKMFEAYLLENGETVIKSVEKYQNKKEDENRKAASLKAKEFLEKISTNNNLPMTGNKDGDITLIEFFDYNCGYCRRALEELVTVLKTEKNVKIIFFDMPILGPASLEASKWSLAAHKQGKYFEFHQALLNHNGQKDEQSMIKIAEDLKLDIKQLKKDKDSDDINATLEENVAQAQVMDIRGTPGFIINGEIYPGYMPAKQIKEIIKKARKNK